MTYFTRDRALICIDIDPCRFQNREILSTPSSDNILALKVNPLPVWTKSSSTIVLNIQVAHKKNKKLSATVDIPRDSYKV